MSLMPWEIIGGLLAGLAALVTAIATAAKLTAEVGQLRRHAHATGEAVQAVKHEVRANSGESLRDSADRTEALARQLLTEMSALRDDVSDLRVTSRRQDHELGRVNTGVAQLAERMTVFERRSDDRHRRHEEHLARLDGRNV